MRSTLEVSKILKKERERELLITRRKKGNFYREVESVQEEFFALIIGSICCLGESTAFTPQRSSVKDKYAIELASSEIPIEILIAEEFHQK